MTITATEFKAKCLQLMDQVQETGEVVTITKRGHVVAELRSPVGEHKPKKSAFGLAKGIMTIVGDITEPLDVDWYSHLDEEWEEFHK